MKTLLFALTLFFAGSGVALAHSVHVFAFVDGDAIQVECRFSKKQKVRHGKLVVSDRETGAVMLEGVTDEQGVFRFRPDDAFLATGHGLTIRLFAGEGHQDEWKLSAKDLQSLSPATAPGRSAGGGREESPPPPGAAAGADGPAAPEAAPSVSEVEEALGRMLDAKLSPIRQALARQEEREPDARDIVGGIGWILGLLGLATYIRYRRTARDDHGT